MITPKKNHSISHIFVFIVFSRVFESGKCHCSAFIMFSCVCKWLPEVFTLRIANTENKRNRGIAITYYFVCYAAIFNGKTEKIACVGYPATSCFSVLVILSVDTRRHFLHPVLVFYQNISLFQTSSTQILHWCEV